MQDAVPRVSRTIWIGVALILLLLIFAVLLSGLQSPRHAKPALLTTGPIRSFTLTNQFGQPVTLTNLQGKVWVADIIFSRCAGPCPRMTRQMAELQAALPPEGSVQLVTLTTDPDFDTPEVLNKYAERFNADPNRWWFLTGDKREIATLATEGLKLTGFIETKPEERSNPNDLFIHSTLLVVVDKQARLRGVFETDNASGGWKKIQHDILDTLRMLEQE